jgi:predicted nucleotidyltransferase
MSRIAIGYNDVYGNIGHNSTCQNPAAEVVSLMKLPGTYRIRTRKRRVKPSVLADVVRRVVEAAQPDQIILFGSAARGDMGPNSDLDLLVVKGGHFHRDRLVQKIYSRLFGAGAAVDIIVVTPDEVERYRNTHCLVIAPALKEGKVVYGA